MKKPTKRSPKSAPFRPTTWPGEAVPVPAVSRRGVEWLNDRYAERVEGGADVELPDEFFLRELLELDVSSDSELRGFVAAYGAPRLPVASPGFRATYLSGFADEVDGFAAAQGHDPRFIISIREMRFYLRALQALARHWAAHVTGQGNLADAWEASGFARPKTENAAWLAFSDIINEGLRSFSARVELRLEDEPDFQYGRPHHEIFSAVCLQIANHIAEGADYRVCAAEDCDHLFFRQRGRAEYGQNRKTGVLYCSTTCAKRQSMRNYRRKGKGSK